MRKLTPVMLLAILLFAYGSFRGLVLLPPSVEPQLENNYRIIFFHVPSAITSFTAFTVTLVAAINYLRTRDYKWDIYASSSAKAGFFFITAALISGSIWARVAWGSFWNWDPRETAVLILWFAYAAYFALRSSIDNLEEKAKNSSILAIFAYATVPLSYFSTRIYFSLHPSPSSVPLSGISLGVKVGSTLGMMITAFMLLYISFLILESKLEFLKIKAEEVEE